MVMIKIMVKRIIPMMTVCIQCQIMMTYLVKIMVITIIMCFASAFTLVSLHHPMEVLWGTHREKNRHSHEILFKMNNRGHWSIMYHACVSSAVIAVICEQHAFSVIE